MWWSIWKMQALGLIMTCQVICQRKCTAIWNAKRVFAHVHLFTYVNPPSALFQCLYKTTDLLLILFPSEFTKQYSAFSPPCPINGSTGKHRASAPLVWQSFPLHFYLVCKAHSMIVRLLLFLNWLDHRLSPWSTMYLTWHHSAHGE